MFFGSHESAMLVFPHSFGLKNWPNRKDKVAFSKSECGSIGTLQRSADQYVIHY